MAKDSRRDRELRQQSPGLGTTGRVDPNGGARSRRAAAGEQSAGQRYRETLKIQPDGSLEVHHDGTLRVDGRKQLGVRNKWPTPTEDTQAANKAYVDQAVADAVAGITFTVPADAEALLRTTNSYTPSASGYTRVVHNVNNASDEYDPDNYIRYNTSGGAAVINKACVTTGHSYVLHWSLHIEDNGTATHPISVETQLGWEDVNAAGSTVTATNIAVARTWFTFGVAAHGTDAWGIIHMMAIIKPIKTTFSLAPILCRTKVVSGSIASFSVTHSHLLVRKLRPAKTLGSALPPPADPISGPTARFHAVPTSGALSRGVFTVTFYDSSEGEDITAWSWDFGDSTTSTSQNPVKNYTATGTYTVSLTVTNAYGNDTETKTSYITVT